MVHFVGAGPGAPDLITLRGAALLESADQVIYAGSLVNPALLERCKADMKARGIVGLHLITSAGGFLPGDYTPLPAFSASHPVSAEEAALFDAAVGDYPMINANAIEVASRAIDGGTEYLFTAADKPREGMAQENMVRFQVYVTALDGAAPEFTQVVR